MTIFGDGAFQSDARVHLHEVVVQLIVQQKLMVPADVAHGLRQRTAASSISSRTRPSSRARLLDHLLVVALHRAIRPPRP